MTELPAVDELGRRLQLAIAVHEPQRRRTRRWWALGATLVVLVGAPAAATVTRVFNPHGDVPREAAAVLDPSDPVRTGRRLQAQGYTIRWRLIQDAPPGSGTPTIGRDVDAPPAGTELLAILGPDGSREIDPVGKHVTIEVAPRGSRILAGHRGP